MTKPELYMYTKGDGSCAKKQLAVLQQEAAAKGSYTADSKQQEGHVSEIRIK